MRERRAHRWLQTEVVHLLLRRKADVNQRDAQGKTALIKACSVGACHEAVVRELLSSDADDSLEDDEGKSALVAVAETGDEKILQLLLAHGKAKDKRTGAAHEAAHDEQTKKALDAARVNNSIRCAHTLLRTMVDRRSHKDLHAAGGEAPPSYDDRVRADVYGSNQQTMSAQQRLQLLLADAHVRSVRLSMPPFNRPLPGVQYYHQPELYEVPVFGLRISAAIMRCFELDGLHALATELEV